MFVGIFISLHQKVCWKICVGLILTFTVLPTTLFGVVRQKSEQIKKN